MRLTKQHLKRIIREEKQKLVREGGMKDLYGECQNEVYAMAQENGYVCHLCVSQAIESCGMGPADMHLCCQIIEDCILSGMLKPGRCPEYPEVTVYFPVM